jgi:hypothetical protein
MGTVRLRRSFECPCCGSSLQIRGVREWATRLTALAVALIAAWAMGFEGILIVGIGVVICPLMVIPVWKLSTVALPPVLIPASPRFTTLDLGGKKEARSGAPLRSGPRSGDPTV